ncbi:High-affinity glucose transporter [Pleurostoma richardsiae]|uniref:High-affinity glucose transporter n=1 Tax=Pleurostoma richardsiae TaxID=41990 RepID=A0AA38VGL8_9PEZI|nr:High-affinity glucose transporter [Pleurostoma richardsiae]
MLSLPLWGLLACDSPSPIKIPFSTASSRLPSNIPLRTLPGQHGSSTSRQEQQAAATSLLGNQHRPRSRSSPDDSSDSDSSWTDTGDIAEQLDAEDPLRTRITENSNSLDDEILAGVLKRHPRQLHQKKKKHVRIQSEGGTHPSYSRSNSHNRSGHRSRYPHAGAVNKEAIEIPDIASRKVSRAERLLAAIMTGGRNSIHGLTGKPLIYFTSIFVSLGVFLFGYDQGVMSGIITGPYFISYFGNPSKAQVGTMVAILEIGALISSLMVGRIGDIIGRRRTILYGSCIFFVGGALQTFATSMAMMMVGRIIAGLGVGTLSTIVPVYQSEISPPHNRGKLACIEFSGNIIGYTTSVWVDYFCGFIDGDYSWRLPLLMQCVMGALLGFGSLIIVESPRWLLDNDHDEEGIVVIANLYGGGDIHNHKARDEFREIKMGVLLHRQEGERTYADMFRRYRTRVFIAMSAQALAQLNGINVISYYAPYVFESAGWYGHDAVLMTGINGITYFLSTIPPWYIVDTWGRRWILLSGAVIMTFSLSLISYFIYLDVRLTPTLVVVFVMIYNAAFGYSWGPIPWLYPPEILPLSIRSKGASLSTATNWAFNWLVGEMTPILQEWIKWRLYLVHAFFCAVSFVIVYFIYPETSGVRLEDMNSIFGDSTSAMGTPASAGTPAMRPERAGSPVPSLDIRGRPLLGADNSFPGLNVEPPAVNVVDGKPQYSEREGGISGWISRVVNRTRSPANGSSSNNGRYAPLGQRED